MIRVQSPRISLGEKDKEWVPVEFSSPKPDPYSEKELFHSSFTREKLTSSQFKNREFIFKPTLSITLQQQSTLVKRETVIVKSREDISINYPVRGEQDFRHWLQSKLTLNEFNPDEIKPELEECRKSYALKKNSLAKIPVMEFKHYYNHAQTLKKNSSPSPFSDLTLGILDSKNKFREILRNLMLTQEKVEVIKVELDVTIIDSFTLTLGSKNHKLEARVIFKKNQTPHLETRCNQCQRITLDGAFCPAGHYICDDHHEHCEECGRLICELCDDEAKTCTKCQKLTCHNHMGFCRHCEKAMCFEHQMTCKECNLPSCYQCMETCSHCSELFCQEHIRLCQIDSCGLFTCDEHRLYCDTCGITGCTSHFTITKSGKALCREHINQCSVCAGIFTKNELLTCEICDATICSEDLYSCQSCLKKGCKKHFHHDSKTGLVACESHLQKCSVCGCKHLEKDFHSCKFCLKTLCSYCIKSCAVCKDQGCEEHFFTNQSGKILCHREIGVCNTCEKTVAITSLTTCLFCQKATCLEHQVKCDVCQVAGCEDHFLKYFRNNSWHFLCPEHRFVCHHCETPVEKKEVKICDVCNVTLCKKHLVTCSSCGIAGCKNHFTAKPDGTYLCDKHDVICQLCKKIVKLQDALFCNHCRKYHCSDHIQSCQSCFQPHCLQDKKTCFQCEQDYCLSCFNSESALCKGCDTLEKGAVIPQLFFRAVNEPEINRAIEKGDYRLSQNLSHIFFEATLKKIFAKATRVLILINKKSSSVELRKDLK